MGLTAILYKNYSKPVNSTRQPLAEGDSFSYITIEPFSVISPYISFNQGATWNPAEYNYAYLPDFKRYYFMNDWTCDGSRWYIHLTVDAMASWKTDILKLDEYVVRSETSYDGTIIDSLYPATSAFNYNVKNFYLYSEPGFPSGCFVLGVAGGADSGIGGVTYYCFDETHLILFFNYIFQNTDWINGATVEITDELLKCLFNPSQYLTSLTWFPFSVDEISSGKSENPTLGWWEIGIACDVAKAEVIINDGLIRDSHPQSARGSYLNYAPYTELNLYIPGFGNLSLDTHKYTPGRLINFTLAIDTVTGLGTFFAFPVDGREGQGTQLTSQVGVPLSIVELKSDWTGALNTVLSAAGTGFIGGGIGALLSTAGSITDAIQQITPDPNIIGNNGNLSTYHYPGVFTQVFKPIVSEDIHHYGRPLYQHKVLGTLSGYVQLAHFDGNLPCSVSEQETIKGYLEGGCFIE